MNTPVRSQRKATFPYNKSDWKDKQSEMVNNETTVHMIKAAPSWQLNKSGLAFPAFKQPLHEGWFSRKASSDIGTASPTANKLHLNALKCKASSDDERLIRRGMVRLIEKKLQNTMTDEDFPLSTLADALEKHLHKIAPTFREYTDSKTLNSRLRLVTVALLRRRRKEQQRTSRLDVLIQVIGEEQYREAAQLVSQVKLLRLQRLARDFPRCAKDGTCEISGGSFNTPFEAQDKVPEPVRLLFFRTQLVQSFENAPSERIPVIRWNDLLEEARSNMERYREWDQENNDPSVRYGDESSESAHSAESLHTTAV